jgi:RNA polymerase sigma factor (sigma-70 family)
MTQPQPSDGELMRRSRTDGDAFCVVYQRYAPKLHRWFARQARDTAADMTAEVFAQAWLSRKRFRDNAEGSAGPWLFGIAQNILRESVRRQAVETRGRRKLGLAVEFADDEGYVEVDERLSTPPTTLAALAALPPDQRRAIELRVLDELG